MCFNESGNWHPQHEAKISELKSTGRFSVDNNLYKKIIRVDLFQTDWTTRDIFSYKFIPVVQLSLKLQRKSSTHGNECTEIEWLRRININYRKKSIQQKFNVIQTNRNIRFGHCYSFRFQFLVRFFSQSLFILLPFSFKHESNKRRISVNQTFYWQKSFDIWIPCSIWKIEHFVCSIKMNEMFVILTIFASISFRKASMSSWCFDLKLYPNSANVEITTQSSHLRLIATFFRINCFPQLVFFFVKMLGFLTQTKDRTGKTKLENKIIVTNHPKIEFILINILGKFTLSKIIYIKISSCWRLDGYYNRNIFDWYGLID